ncbi:uncharacterized protein (DUF58 family) [Catenulispora sp. MAP5-51]|uniref:DUF58 domain-containing protein n=1 Tax=Catenulispora sp. MAP5-51 TaxID=3156298 RepID=UPI003517596F
MTAQGELLGVTPFHKALTARGWLLLAGSAAVVGAALALGYPELAGVGSAGVAAVLVAMVTVARTPALAVDRYTHPPQVTRGTPDVTARLDVHNTSRWSLPSARTRLIAGAANLPVKLPAVAGGATAQVQSPTLPTARRGVVRVGPLLVTRADPFGLARRVLDTGTFSELYVRPRPVRLPDVARSLARSVDGSQAETKMDGTLAFHRLREYVPGDERRHIHWLATAHAGRVLVKQHVDTAHAAVAVLVDVVPGGREGAFGEAFEMAFEAAFEVAVDCAASAAVCATERGDPLVLVDTFGRSLLDQGGRGARARRSATTEGVLNALTRVVAEPPEAQEAASVASMGSSTANGKKNGAGSGRGGGTLGVGIRRLAESGRGSLAIVVSTRSLTPWATDLKALTSSYARVIAVHATDAPGPATTTRIGRVLWTEVRSADELPAALHRARAAA